MKFHTLEIGHKVEYLFDFPSNKRFCFILIYEFSYTRNCKYNLKSEILQYAWGVYFW